MSNLAAIQASQLGADPAISLDSSFVPTFEMAVVPQQNVVFKLKHKKKGRHYIDGINNNVVNPTTKKRERIYLIRGADSIWQSDLVELLKDKDYISKNRVSLCFEDSILRIPINEERMLEFARANNNNMKVSNRMANGKHDFYEYDPVAEQKERHGKQMLKLKMVVKANEMPVEKMKKLASFLGVMPVDDLGMAKTDDGIRSELMIKADNDPITFEKYIDSQEVEISYMVKRSIIDNKIDLGGQQGNAIWSGGKGFIAKIPANRKAYEYLTEFAMTNSNEGRAFKEQLQNLVT